MFYDNELTFLCETLKKVRLRAAVIEPGEPICSVMDSDIYSVFGNELPQDMPLRAFIGELAERTMYKSTDDLHLCYIYFLLPKAEKETLLFIGPYLSDPLTSEQILDSGGKTSVPPKSHKYISEYYSHIPILTPDSNILVMINTFCERIWQSQSFSIVDVKNESSIPVSPINETAHSETFDALLMNMKAMENRYSFENELMQAVTLGQIHKETQLFSAFPESTLERRASDPLRNAKNYCIIMNTLLRKAAEKGGVHPIYLDAMSSSFAMKIEQLPALPDSFGLMTEMFRSYCRLVRKHSMKDFSPVVRKTVLLVDSDLSADLSLKTLAEAQNISAGYLSAVFKKETGKTVSEFIREKRIKHAVHLLTTTHLQVQTIALHCGIMDVQYFTKLFKKETGMTPKQYRENTQNTQKI